MLQPSQAVSRFGDRAAVKGYSAFDLSWFRFGLLGRGIHGSRCSDPIALPRPRHFDRLLRASNSFKSVCFGDEVAVQIGLVQVLFLACLKQVFACEGVVLGGANAIRRVFA